MGGVAKDHDYTYHPSPGIKNKKNKTFFSVFQKTYVAVNYFVTIRLSRTIIHVEVYVFSSFKVNWILLHKEFKRQSLRFCLLNLKFNS